MFDNAFFAKFPQSRHTFVDDNGEERTYEFPTFYQGTRGMVSFYSCSWAKAAASLPSGRLIPVPAGFGKALLTVGCFEYLNPKGMGPYNEVLFAIPAIHIKKQAGLPDFGLFIKRLIVDVEENVQRGKHIWGMDKSMGEIQFFEESGMRVCEVHRNGREGLRIEAPQEGPSARFTRDGKIFTEKDGKLLTARSAMSGRRKITRGKAKISLLADPFAAELDSMELSERPLRTEFYSSVDHIMGLPQDSEPL